MPKVPKSPDARAREVEMIRCQLDDLGLPGADLQPIHAALDEFAREGVGVTQAWKLPAFGVRVTVLLSTQSHIISYAKIGRL